MNRRLQRSHAHDYPATIALLTLRVNPYKILVKYPLQWSLTQSTGVNDMTDAIKTYQYIRAQQQTRPVDACADAAQYHGVTVAALAAALIAADIDAARLSLI
jgi:hypothetical protein